MSHQDSVAALAAARGQKKRYILFIERGGTAAISVCFLFRQECPRNICAWIRMLAASFGVKHLGREETLWRWTLLYGAVVECSNAIFWTKLCRRTALW